MNSAEPRAATEKEADKSKPRCSCKASCLFQPIRCIEARLHVEAKLRMEAEWRIQDELAHMSGVLAFRPSWLADLGGLAVLVSCHALGLSKEFASYFQSVLCGNIRDLFLMQQKRSLLLRQRRSLL